MNLNRCLLAGNLTRDPELRYTPKGTAICVADLAINRRWKSETGETKEEVTFVGCTFFGTMAENVAQYFSKGKCIFVEGRLKLDSWEDKQSGQKRQKLHIIAEGFQFVDKKQDGDGERKPQPRPAARPAAAPAPAEEGGEGPPEGDDVPF